MGKSKKGLEWLNRALFISPYCFALCKTEKQFYAELKRLEVPEKTWPDFILGTHASATVHFFTNGAKHIDSCAIVCVRIKKGADQVAISGLLVHEAVHIWQEIKDRIGEQRPSSEFEAYAIQSIAQNLMAAWRDN